MQDLLGYEGRAVVVTGAASGMGRATAQMLVDLGAKVYALDVADVTVPVVAALRVDLKDPESIDGALAHLPDDVHALFNCAGVPSPPFSARDTVLINFCGLRHLTEALLPRMAEGGAIASIASTAGMAWRPRLETLQSFLDTCPDFEAANKWMSEHPDSLADGYGFSKQCIIVYTLRRAGELARRNVRINCISPSPTASAFMETLKGEGQVPDEAIELFLPPNGRYANGDDMARPLIVLNSDLAGFVSGVNLPVDFGFCAEVLTRQRDDLLGIAH